MSILFPVSIDSFTNPQPLQPQSSPSHSQQHANANDAIAALETKVGVDGSVDSSSLDYLVKSSGSLNPGHRHSTASITNFPTFVDREVPGGAINGVNAVFSIAHTPTAGSELFFVNGILQNSGAGNDYVLSGTILTCASAPGIGSVLLVCYRY